MPTNYQNPNVAFQTPGAMAGVGPATSQYAPTSSAISVAGLSQPQTPIQIQPLPTSGVDGALGAAQTTIDTLNKQIADLQSQKTPTDASALFEKYLGSETPPPSAAGAYNDMYAQSGLDAKQQQTLTDKTTSDAIDAQLAGLNYQYNTVIPTQDEQNAVGKQSTYGQQVTTAADQRQKLLEIAPLQFQSLIAKAKALGSQSLFDAAQTHLDKIYSIQQQDAANLYNYQKDLRAKVYDFATAQQKATLDAQQKQADQNFTLLQNNLNNAQAIAKSASDNGQSDIAAKILALDPHSATYQSNVANLQAQIQVKQDQWSAPYYLGGDIVQKNTKTGEIRTAVNVTGGGVNAPISLTTTDKQSLLGSGLTQNEINNIQADVNAHGINAVLAGITDPAQKTAILKAYGGQASAKFLTKDYLKGLYDTQTLEKAASDAGYTKGGFLGAFKSADTEAYLTHLQSMIDQYRTAGYSDQDILKMLQ